MSITRLDQPAPANLYDNALRFTIPSRSIGHETHMVDLDAYDMNGMCDCMHFAARLQPHLARNITPEQAIAQGLVKLKKNQRPEDALRCFHIIEAYHQFGQIAARAISNAKKITIEANRPPPSF